MSTYLTQLSSTFSSSSSFLSIRILSATPAMLVPQANRRAGLLLGYHRLRLTSWLASSPNDFPIISPQVKVQIGNCMRNVNVALIAITPFETPPRLQRMSHN